MNLQPNEVLIIVFVALIVLGPTRLPGAIRGIGRAFRQLRDFSATIRQEMDATLSPPVIEPADPPARPTAPTESAAAEPQPASPPEVPEVEVPEVADDSAMDRSPSDGPA